MDSVWTVCIGWYTSKYMWTGYVECIVLCARSLVASEVHFFVTTLVGFIRFGVGLILLGVFSVSFAFFCCTKLVCQVHDEYTLS